MNVLRITRTTIHTGVTAGPMHSKFAECWVDRRP